MMDIGFTEWFSMSFPDRLVQLRKQRHLSQIAMAEVIGIHPNSLKKYETGQSQPSLEILRKIATTFNVSTDFLIFEDHERGPTDGFALQFEAIGQLLVDEQKIVREVLDSLIIKFQTRRWDSLRTTEE